MLWVLVILSSLTMSLSRSTHVDLAISKQAIGKLKAKYLAWGGLIYAMEQARIDAEDAQSNTKDNLYYCGIRVSQGQSPEQLFQNRILGDGHFEVSYQVKLNGERKTYYGMQDEERLINLNALNVQSVNVVSSLLELLGYDKELAKTISYSMLDWKDEDKVLSEQQYGAEDDYYAGASAGYKTKNYLFESFDELLLVRGVTKDILKAIRPFVTVYGRNEVLRVNFETASETVLKALARAQTEFNPTVSVADADTMVGKLVSYRRGDDGVDFTEDDRAIELAEDANLNTPEQMIFYAMSQFRTRQSEYLRIRVKGVADDYNIQDRIEAVIQRADSAIISWVRN